MSRMHTIQPEQLERLWDLQDPERIDTEFVRIIGPLATEAAIREKGDFAAWEQEFITPDHAADTPADLKKSGESGTGDEAMGAHTGGPQKAAEFSPGKFPESDNPYGPGTVSEDLYRRRLNWRLDMAGQDLNRARIGSGEDADKRAALEMAVYKAKQNGDPYSQIDDVIAVERKASGFVQRTGLE